ncbi:DUF4411 family protein [Achromobacter spanius]|uniref:DUF4411 family protein n=1 Tax=Achromobacter spanius TaxID=217203 RepID=UPI0032099C29
MRYLLDSDALIAAKDLYYKPSYCAGFWGWLNDCHAHGALSSIDKVRDELLRGNLADHLVSWARQKDHEGFFQNSAGALRQFQALTQWAHQRQPSFKQPARDKFLRAESADIWLIAFAANYPGQYTIVTNEVSAPQSTTSIKLPDAAQHLGVQTINIFALLDRFAHNTFTFRP